MTSQVRDGAIRMAGNSLVTPSYLQAHDLDHTAASEASEVVHRGSLMRANECGEMWGQREGASQPPGKFLGFCRCFGATRKRRKKRRQWLLLLTSWTIVMTKTVRVRSSIAIDL